MTSIYLDYNASTPIDPAVAAAMRPFLDHAFGNPSSGHWASTSAKAALENARGQVARLLDCGLDEIVFTTHPRRNQTSTNGAPLHSPSRNGARLDKILAHDSLRFGQRCSP